ncbi:MAG: hypothetical protein GX879_03605 [Bacteroidales bacterium]|nr:hypothetical protein [Bacteroidales bacterium]
MLEFWQNIKLLMINPPKAWRQIRKQEQSFKDVFFKKVLLIIAVTTLCRFVGESLSTANTASFLYIFLDSFLFFVYNVLAFYVLSLILNAILPNYGSKKNIAKVSNLLIYSLTLYYFVISIASLFPSLLFLYILPIYCFFILWYGVQQMLNLHEEGKLGYYIITVILMIGIYTIFYFVIKKALLSLIV